MTAMLLLFGFSKALFDQSKVERVPKQKTVYKKHMFPLMYSWWSFYKGSIGHSGQWDDRFSPGDGCCIADGISVYYYGNLQYGAEGVKIYNCVYAPNKDT